MLNRRSRIELLRVAGVLACNGKGTARELRKRRARRERIRTIRNGKGTARELRKRRARRERIRTICRHPTDGSLVDHGIAPEQHIGRDGITREGARPE